ncbi:integrating conjugative element protein [Enterobacteriaceae bacterium H11S18]|uniref:integrating conjugative element protein n=1 Tax=Dryocola clanedunensis TaxID=2925396 RepID=UPI0022F09C55|nr:integrating conjugative element protein [Dryocola clanedunensis]MCT4711332.1 integrating conjugative element protein [Dryocola clanedunensis]
MKKTCFILLMVGMLSPLSGQCALTVIADLGGQPTDDYFSAINRQPAAGEAPPVMAAPRPSGEATMLPVSTPELTPGRETARPLKLPGIGALFLVGDDALSRRWLADNRDRLQKMNAAGMIVNVQSQQGVASLRELVPGITLAPASGSSLARRLQLSHYPVLITDAGLTP